MKNVTLRLLYSSYAPLTHVVVAQGSLDSFKCFGALAESACTEENHALDGVKHPRLLRRIASARGDIRLDRMPRSLLDQMGSDLGITSVFGIAMTPFPMMRFIGDELVSLPGSSQYMKCAAVSLAMMSRPIDLDILTAIVKREAGHIFVKKKHCPDERCMLQGYFDFSEFVRRIVIPGLDFCEDCRDEIEGRVHRLILH